MISLPDTQRNWSLVKYALVVQILHYKSSFCYDGYIASIENVLFQA